MAEVEPAPITIDHELTTLLLGVSRIRDESDSLHPSERWLLEEVGARIELLRTGHRLRQRLCPGCDADDCVTCAYDPESDHAG